MEQKEKTYNKTHNNTTVKIKEGNTHFYASKKNIVDKNMKVFYNPLMRENRELSILMILNYLKNTKNKHVKLGFPLSSSGIRPLRLLNENKSFFEKILEEKKIFFYINDLNVEAIKIAEKNFEYNNLKSIINHKNFELKFFNEDANVFLLKNKDFDYIEIDPFGSPNFFLNNAILSLKHKGILSVTATDTAALTGTYPKTTLRKYSTITFKTPLMHYYALKILYSHIFRITSSLDYSIKPLLSYYDLHFIKLFLQLEKNKNKALEVSKKLSLQKVCYNCGNIQEKIYFYDKEYKQKNVIEKKTQIEKVEKTKEETEEKCVLCNHALKNIYPIYEVPMNNIIILNHLNELLKNKNELLKNEKLKDEKEFSNYFSKKLEKKLFLIKKFSIIENEKNKIFFHTHKIASYYNKSAPKNKILIKHLEEKNFKATQCYFDNNIIITNSNYDVVKKFFESYDEK